MMKLRLVACQAALIVVDDVWSKTDIKALAVLLEDMATPLPILQALWQASPAEARRISCQFVDRSRAGGSCAPSPATPVV